MLQSLDRDGIGPDLALSAFQQTGNRAAASIIRTAQDFAGQEVGDDPITAPLAWLDRLIERDEVTLDQLTAISNELDIIFARSSVSLALAEHGRRINEAIIKQLDVISEQDVQVLKELGRNKINLANRLSTLGRREDALEAAEEAVSLYRDLASERSGAFVHSIALSLNNLSNRLSALGRHEDALKAAEEAVSLYRDLVSERQGVPIPVLAISLNNLSGCLNDLGRRIDAFEAAEEAVSLYRDLASEQPGPFAHTLINLANRLSALGRREDALKAAKEAVSLRRRLASERPDAFSHDVALSLSVMADRLEELDRLDEALPCDHEAIDFIGPYFVSKPMGYAQQMMPILKDYLRRCEAAGVEAEHHLLAPILEKAQALTGEQ